MCDYPLAEGIWLADPSAIEQMGSLIGLRPINLTILGKQLSTTFSSFYLFGKLFFKENSNLERKVAKWTSNNMLPRHRRSKHRNEEASYFVLLASVSFVPSNLIRSRGLLGRSCMLVQRTAVGPNVSWGMLI